MYKDIINGKIVINTKTQKEYDDLMTFLEKKGFKWLSGSNPKEVKMFTQYNKNTCISGTNKKITYCDKDWYKRRYCKIVSYNDFMKSIGNKHFKSLPNDYTGIIEIENGFIVEKEILDETEKEYLKTVIRPFKDKIENIRLVERHINNNNVYILVNFISKDNMCFPDFKKGTMYRGMETDKEYTLEELGLDE